MNSKISQSALGQKAIRHFLGSSGNNILEHLQEATTTYYGKAGKKLSSIIIHLSLKGKLLHDSRIITQKDVFHLMDPVNFVMLSLYATLASTEDRVEPEDLHKTGMKLRALITDMLRPHMTQKNINKVEKVMEQLADEGFLKALVCEPDMAEHKEALRTDLADVLSPLLIERDGQDECKFSTCKLKVLIVHDDYFRGLGYCAKHHKKLTLNLQMEPSITHFFNEDKDSEDFETFMTEHLPPNVLALNKGCVNYSRCPKRVRGPFARAIWDKYFDEKKASHPVDQIPPDVLDQVATQLKDPELTTFETVLAICTEHVNKAFESFVESKAFSTYLARLELPEYLNERYRESALQKMRDSQIKLQEVGRLADCEEDENEESD